jgi:hypothetical protein
MTLPANYRGILDGKGIQAGLFSPTLPIAESFTNGVKRNWGKKNPGLAARRLSGENRIYRNAPDDYIVLNFGFFVKRVLPEAASRYLGGYRMVLTAEQDAKFRDLCGEIRPGEYGRVVVSMRL